MLLSIKFIFSVFLFAKSIMAYQNFALLQGIRMLKNKVEDAMEAEALEHCRDTIDIYR